MADKRIKDLGTSITAFRTGDVIPVDGPSGTAKMSKDDLLKETAENALAGNVAPAFDPTRTNDNPYKVGELVSYLGNVYRFKNTHYGAWAYADTDPTTIEREILRTRAMSNFLFFITNDGTLVCDGGYGDYSDSVYFTFDRNLGVRGSTFGTDRSRSLTVSQLATELGVSLVTSPAGIPNCIKLDPSYCLVYNFISYSFSIVSGGSLNPQDLRMLENRTGRLVGGALLCQQTRQVIAQTKSTQVYNGDTSVPYVEQSYKSNASVYVKFSSLLIRGANDRTLSMADIASELSVSLTTSPKGVTGCLAIPNQNVMCCSVAGKLSIKGRKTLQEGDIALYSCLNGLLVNSLLEQKSVFDDYVNPSSTKDYEASASLDFATALNGCTELASTFVFFSDPHCMGTDGVLGVAEQSTTKRMFGTLSEICKANAVDYVVCGGDIITSGDSADEAVAKLGYFASSLKNISDKCVLVNGNHDLNYLGDSPLTRIQQINATHQDTKKLYFDFSDGVTNYFVLDTGLNTSDTLSSYRIEQIKWLADKLQSSDKPNIIFMHIYSNASVAADWTARITTMASEVQTMCSALNSRSTYTIDGVTFDFSTSQSKVACILCGHTHYDYLDTNGGVPVIAITRTINGNDFAFDACVVDYGAGKLKAVRIGGSGISRNIDIVT